MANRGSERNTRRKANFLTLDNHWVTFRLKLNRIKALTSPGVIVYSPVRTLADMTNEEKAALEGRYGAKILASPLRRKSISRERLEKMIMAKETDLQHLRAIAKWLADDNELPSSGDAICILDAIEEIEKLRAAILKWNL